MSDEAILCYAMSLMWDDEDGRSLTPWLGDQLMELDDISPELFFKDLVCAHHDIRPPGEAWDGVDAAEQDYFDSREAVWEVTGIEIVSHVDYHTVLLAARESIIASNYGSKRKLNLKELISTQKQHRQVISAFCNTYQVPFTECGWYLVKF